jgi:hypothetical protein
MKSKLLRKNNPKSIKSMTKKQTVWFYIFLAMFLVPEFLWSAVRSFIYITLSPGKFSDYPLLFNLLPATKNNLLAGIVSISQFIGLFGIFLMIIKLRINPFIKLFIASIILLLLLVSGFLALMGLYYLNHSPQIG